MANPCHIIIGSSGGIGAALCDILAQRTPQTPLLKFARSTPAPFHVDFSKPDSIAAAAQYIKERNLYPEMLIIATGLLHKDEQSPERSWRDLDAQWLAEQYMVNTIGLALVAKYFLPLVPRHSKSIFAVISARVSSISDNRLGGWHGYRASKAALNMMVKNIAIEWVRKNDKAIALAIHPGTVDTALSKPFQRGLPEGQVMPPDKSAGMILDVLNAAKSTDSGKILAYNGREIAP